MVTGGRDQVSESGVGIRIRVGVRIRIRGQGHSGLVVLACAPVYPLLLPGCTLLLPLHPIAAWLHPVLPPVHSYWLSLLVLQTTTATGPQLQPHTCTAMCSCILYFHTYIHDHLLPHTYIVTCMHPTTAMQPLCHARNSHTWSRGAHNTHMEQGCKQHTWSRGARNTPEHTALPPSPTLPYPCLPSHPFPPLTPLPPLPSPCLPSHPSPLLSPFPSSHPCLPSPLLACPLNLMSSPHTTSSTHPPLPPHPSVHTLPHLPFMPWAPSLTAGWLLQVPGPSVHHPSPTAGRLLQVPGPGLAEARAQVAPHHGGKDAGLPTSTVTTLLAEDQWPS